MFINIYNLSKCLFCEKFSLSHLLIFSLFLSYFLCKLEKKSIGFKWFVTVWRSLENTIYKLLIC